MPIKISGSSKSKTITNQTTTDIRDYLLEHGIFSWRNSVGNIGVYQFGLPGSSDIIVVLPSNGRILCIEIKTGKDRLRLEQIGFQKNIEAMGGLFWVIHTYQEFLTKFKELAII